MRAALTPQPLFFKVFNLLGSLRLAEQVCNTIVSFKEFDSMRTLPIVQLSRALEVLTYESHFQRVYSLFYSNF